MAGSATLTEFSHINLPPSLDSGTPVRRALVFIRATTLSTNNTVLLTTYMPEVSDIEGVVYVTDDGAEGTTCTWSTVTLTIAEAGVEEVCLVVVLT